jgi:acyl-coenzyme A thioesterase PaaI-like protein
VSVTRRSAGSADAQLIIDDRHVNVDGVIRRSALLAVIDEALDAVFDEPDRGIVNVLNIQFVGTARVGDVLRATATVTDQLKDQYLAAVDLFCVTDERLIAYATARITRESR